MPAKSPRSQKDAAAVSNESPSSWSDMLGYSVMRLSASIEHLAEVEAQSVAGLRLPEYRVLAVLLGEGPLGVAGLQQAMSIDKAWISRTLTSLAEKELVESKADDVDGRRTSYRLTREGRRIASLLLRRARKREDQTFAGFDARQRQAVFDLLARVQQNVDKLA